MTTDNTTRRQIRILRAYTVVSTTLLGFLAVTAFQRASQKSRFEEIDVERINLVEKDGRVRLVLANDARSPAVVLSGKTLGKPGGRAGMKLVMPKRGGYFPVRMLPRVGEHTQHAA